MLVRFQMQQKAETQIFLLLLISALMLCAAPFFLEDSYNWIKRIISINRGNINRKGLFQIAAKGLSGIIPVLFYL
jgi:uncharacterized membrane protein